MDVNDFACRNERAIVGHYCHNNGYQKMLYPQQLSNNIKRSYTIINCAKIRNFNDNSFRFH